MDTMLFLDVFCLVSVLFTSISTPQPVNRILNVSGMHLVRELSELETYKGSSVPKKYIEIINSGVRDIHKYELSEDQLDFPGDIKPE